jgi:ankyrin repeat protein
MNRLKHFLTACVCLVIGGIIAISIIRYQATQREKATDLFMKAFEADDPIGAEKALRMNPKFALTRSSKSGMTCLHSAVKCGKYNIAEVLIRYGADVNAKDNTGTSPLHIAADHANIRFIELLIDNNADVNIKNSTGYTPLLAATSVSYAKKSGEEKNTQAIRCLLEHGADANAETSIGVIAFETTDNENVLMLLIEHGVAINKRCKMSGYAPIHRAIEVDSLALTKMLVDRGANVNLRTSKGVTPIALAVNKKKSIEDILLDSNRPTTGSNKYLNRMKKQSAIIQYLRSHGAK